MKTYEITFITREDPSADGKTSSVRKDIEALGGRIMSVSILGQKTFVYPIEKNKAGFYTTYIFELDGEKMQDFNRKLALEEEILRHLIIAIRPSEMDIKLGTKEVMALDDKPEMALEVAPTQEIEVAPEMAIEVEPVKEIVAEEAPVKEVKAAKKSVKKEKVEEVKEQKPAKAKAVKVEVKEEKTEAKPKAKKTVSETKTNVPVEDEEERLEALDKKLEELLKD